MADDQGPRHGAPDGSNSADEVFARPEGVSGGFADRPHPAPEPRRMPPVAPGDEQRFGRPDGAAGFEPRPVPGVAPHSDSPPGRVADRRRHLRPQCDQRARRLRAAAGLAHLADPARAPGRDPEELKLWSNRETRDYWLGRGAVFNRGRPMQLHPAQDSATRDPLSGLDDVAPGDPSRSTWPSRVTMTTTPLAAAPAPAGSGRLGLSAIALMALVALVAGGVGGAIGYVLTHRGDGLLHKGNVKLAQGGTPANRPPGSVADLAKRVGPAVVSIAVTTSDSYGVGVGCGHRQERVRADQQPRGRAGRRFVGLDHRHVLRRVDGQGRGRRHRPGQRPGRDQGPDRTTHRGPPGPVVLSWPWATR